jgi:hypothetical protein
VPACSLQRLFATLLKQSKPLLKRLISFRIRSILIRSLSHGYSIVHQFLTLRSHCLCLSKQQQPQQQRQNPPQPSFVETAVSQSILHQFALTLASLIFAVLSQVQGALAYKIDLP